MRFVRIQTKEECVMINYVDTEFWTSAEELRVLESSHSFFQNVL